MATQEWSYTQYLKSSEAQAVFRLSQSIMEYMREFLRDRGFIEFLPPIISSLTDPGLRGAERLPVSIYGNKAYVTSSMVFHKQVLASAFGRIFAFSPNVRLEPAENARSGRHLVEFCQMDLEEASVSYEDSMALAEEMLQTTIAKVVKNCKSLLATLGRDLKVPARPFKRFKYSEIAGSLERSGELTQEEESRISKQVGDFFWITGYPKASRGFYYREEDDCRFVRSMDLIFPEGYGEAISGGEREYRPCEIKRRIAENGLDLDEFGDLVTAAEAGLKPTSGFGIGVERLTRYISGEKNIARVRPFPKMPGFIGM